MCYHTAYDADWEQMKARYRREVLTEVQQIPLPLFHASAFSRPWWPVITAEEPKVIGQKQWGLVPKWVKDPKEFLRRTPTYNAISEEAYEKRTFKNAMAAGRRLLIPVTGFFEWQHRGKEKVPHYITMREEHIFSLGGIYEGETYSILTRPAQTLMATIHNSKKRQPVIIPKAFENDWLNPLLQKEDVLRFCSSVEEHDLVAHTISDLITDRTLSSNVAEVSAPFAYPGP